MQPNTIFYLVGYIVLMMPTYILPYFGSNSAVINSIGAVAGVGMTPQWWAHIWSLTMLCLLAWARGGVANRRWLPVLPFLAAVFDLMPLLSMIPLVPTGLHLAALIVGSTISDPIENRAAGQLARNRKALLGAAGVTACSVGGVALFLATMQGAIETFEPPSKAAMPNEKVPTPAVPVPFTKAVMDETEPTPASAPSAAVAGQASRPVDESPQAQANRPGGRERVPVARQTPPAQTARKPNPSSADTTTRYINLSD